MRLNSLNKIGDADMAKHDFHQLTRAVYLASRFDDTLTDELRLQLIKQARIILNDPEACIKEARIDGLGNVPAITDASAAHGMAFAEERPHVKYFVEKNTAILKRYEARFPNSGVGVYFMDGQFTFPDDDTKIHFMMATPSQ